MSWFNVWDGLKNKTCRYLLQRYLGQFLEERLDLEQLNVELYNGRATVKNVALRVSALNELFEAQGWSFEVTGGRIGLIMVTVPWNALTTNDSSIEIEDLFISLKPVKRQYDGSSMLESMWSSVSSSMQLAQEYMQQNDDVQLNTQNNSMDGLQKFAETIDNVLNRIRAKCTNVVLKLDYIPEHCEQGMSIVIKLDSLNYRNVAEHGQAQIYTKSSPADNLRDAPVDEEAAFDKSRCFLSVFATHNIMMDGVRIYTEEYKVNSHEDKGVDFAKLYNRNATELLWELQTDDNERRSHCASVPIPMLEIKGQQKITFKTKQSEAISGPKVIVDIELGAVCVLVTPRQIHMLALFYDSLSVEEHVEGPGGERRNLHSSAHSPECLRADQRRYNSNMSGVVGSHNIWSDTFDEELTSCTNETFHEVPKSNYCESVSSSLSSYSNATHSSRFQRKLPNFEICGDISKFHLNITKLEAVVLQEDILIESNAQNSKCPLNIKSQIDMITTANAFFATFNYDTPGNSVKKVLHHKNHLYLRVLPIIGEGMQQRNRNVLVLNLSLNATALNLCEILEDNVISLIEFNRESTDMEGYNKRPELTVQLKSTNPFNSAPYSKHCKRPKTDVDITLEQCNIEVDISIYDRLSAIIGCSPFRRSFPHHFQTHKRKPVADEAMVKAHTNIRLTTTILGIKLRFPIVDVRPIHVSDRAPWWKQNVRADFLLIKFSQLRLSLDLKTIEIIANEINTYYYCKDSMEMRTHLLKVNMAASENICAPTKATYQYPRITIEIMEKSKEVSSTDDIWNKQNRTERVTTIDDGSKLPFSAKRVCRQSDALHAKPDASEESETILLPGETSEIKNFCEKAMKASKLQIKINFPVAILQLESKEQYEIIYNRISSDLLLWEPCSPFFKTTLDVTPPELEMRQSIHTVGLMDSLYVPSTMSTDNDDECNRTQHANQTEKRSQKLLASSSDSELDDSKELAKRCDSKWDNSIYISAREEQDEQECSAMGALIEIQNLNKSCIEFTIGKGLLTIFVSVQNSNDALATGQLGEFMIRVNALSIFLVNDHNSNEHLAYLCLHLKDLEVFHCGLIPISLPTAMRSFNADVPSYMEATFYKTPRGLTKGKVVGCDKREMLSFVIEIKKIPHQKIKRLKITTGIQKTTLRYNPALPCHTWLTQLLDFLDVVDYPVSGYKPFRIITEMQLHLWDCAIDYRPKNLPVRSVVEIGAFDISSNIISCVTGCTLRFVMEECVLSICPFENNGEYTALPRSKITHLPAMDLVTVLDIGLLDISLRLNGESTQNCPKFDLRSSIQDVHIRTCSDSGTALSQLIAYLASNGDITARADDEPTDTASTSSVYSDASGDGAKRESPYVTTISESQQERVNTLMAEAVEETVKMHDASSGEQVDDTASGELSTKVFYFPDEDNPVQIKRKDSALSSGSTTLQSKCTDSCHLGRTFCNVDDDLTSQYYFAKDDDDAGILETLPQIRRDLGDVSNKNYQRLLDENSFSSDDDYYFIPEEEKTYMSNFGVKNVQICDDPLRIVDNHFYLPAGKADLLKSPRNFPMPSLRYTLCEMTLTWHLYGGNDFPPLADDRHRRQSSPHTKHHSVEGASAASSARMSETYKHGVSNSKGPHGAYKKKPKEKLTWKTIGGKHRNHEVLVEIQLSKVRFSHEMYPAPTAQACWQVLTINDIEIRDRLQSSDINKFLYHPKLSTLTSKSNEHMVIIKALHERSNPKLNVSQECSLRISLLPLRLHIDQDTLLFLIQFFTSLGENCAKETLSTAASSSSSSSSSSSARLSSGHSCLTHTAAHCDEQAPVMMVEDCAEAIVDEQRQHSTESGECGEGDTSGVHSTAPIHEAAAGKTIKNSTEPLYFREIVFSPEVLIRFDYHGRRVQLTHGPIAGLIMGLGQLQCSEIRLRKIVHKRGLLGIEKLISFLCEEWMEDIKNNQLPNILSGIGPTYAFVQLFQGIYDLFRLPIQQFQKDGRLIRGLQLGAQSFTARTALAALEITTRIIQILQFTAETAFDMVSPGPTVRRSGNTNKGRRKRQQRPKDIREGVTNAYILLKEGFNNSAHSLIETAVIEHEQKGYTGAVGAVMRQIPQLVVCPAVLATQATTNILGGVKSSLVPEAKLEAHEKWKEDTE